MPSRSGHSLRCVDRFVKRRHSSRSPRRADHRSEALGSCARLEVKIHGRATLAAGGERTGGGQVLGCEVAKYDGSSEVDDERGEHGANFTLTAEVAEHRGDELDPALLVERRATAATAKTTKAMLHRDLVQPEEALARRADTFPGRSPIALPATAAAARRIGACQLGIGGRGGRGLDGPRRRLTCN
jgi:hypothetical protein